MYIQSLCQHVLRAGALMTVFISVKSITADNYTRNNPKLSLGSRKYALAFSDRYT